MNKKIFILLFFLIVLISMSAVSAVDIGDNNKTVVSSDIGVEKLSVSNDVNSIDDLNEDNDKLALSGTDVLGTDNGNYSGLSEEIAQPGNVKLSYKNYVYDGSTDTIEITEANKVIDGNGAVIDMAGSTIRAFTVSASGVTIKNLTIKNVNFEGGTQGGAIFFSESGIVENCTFVNNTAEYGGAVYWTSGANMSNCNFTINSAIDGGAFYVRYGNTTVTNCTFEGNKASRNGGAIRIGETENENSFVTNSKFINNRADGYGGAIYADDNPDYVSTTTADTCLFKTDSDTTNNTIILLPTLNVDDFISDYGSGENISFDLRTNISSMKVNDANITIHVFSQDDNSEVAKYTFLSGEKWTVDLPAGKYMANYSTEFDSSHPVSKSIEIYSDSAITLDNVTLDYGEVKNVTVATEGATGVTATINGYALPVIDNFTVQISDLAVGNYTLTVTTIPDASHLSVTKTTNVTVNKVNSTLDVSDIEFNYGSEGSANVTYSGAIKVVAEIINQPKAVVNVSGNKINVSGLAAGKYTLNVTTVPDDNHTAVSKTAEVTVNKINSTVTAEDVEMDYGKSVNVTATVEGATGITAKIGDKDLAVDNLTIPISGLGGGNYTLTITTIPDENHTSVNKSVNITVNKISSEIKLINETLDLKANDTVSDFAQLTPDNGTLNYVSSDESVAKIENGAIVAVSAGKANITVSFDGNENYTASEANISLSVIPMDTRIVLNSTEYVLEIDSNATINATTVPEGLDITYVSNDTSVVKVENGVITGLKEGNATITLIIGDNKAYAINSTVINVSVKKISTAIEVENKTLEAHIDEVSQINATLNPSEAGRIKYALSDVSFISVDENGNVRGIKEGTTTVILSFAGDDKYAAAENVEITVIVTKVPTEITVADEKVNITVDEIRETGASLTPADAGNLTYSSDNESIVKVEDGKLVGVSEGNATITVSFSGDDKYAGCDNKTIAVTVSLNDASVSAEDITLKIDDNATIEATTSPEGLNVTYAADDSGVVSVENGVVTGLKEGTAVITLTVGGDGKYVLNSTTITVTVLKIDTSIEAADKMEMEVGDNITAEAALVPAEAGELNFTSSDLSVVTVNATGELKAVSEGTAIITVKFQGNDKYNAAESKNIIVTVKKVPTSIDADEKVSMKVGDNVTVNATLTPAEAGELIFTSDDESVVTVNALGELTAVGEGSTFITVKFAGDDKYAAAESKKILVTVSKIETSIDVVDKVDMKVDDNVNVNATLTPDVAGELEFTSSDESVVTVNALGELTAVAEGKAVIYVKFSGNNKYAAAESKNILVTVNKIPTSISADENVDMKVDDKVTVNATLSPDVAGELEFVSGDVSVVTVNNLGEITAVGEGIANVTVRFTGNDKYAAAESKNITVTVSKIDTSIEVVDQVDMKVGDNVTADAVLSPADAGELEFVSGDESVVTVNALGEITAVGEGIANVTVIFTGNDKYAAAESKNITVTVSKIDTSIEVVDQVDMKVGDNVTADAILTPDVAGELEFASSDESVVTVNDLGEITAVGEGSAIVTVSFTGNDKYAAAESKNITVTVSKIDTSIDAADKVEMKVGDIIALNATLTPAEAGELEFVSGDSSIVSVNSQGELTGVGKGTTVITVSFAGNDKYNAAATKYVIVNVTKIDTSIDVEDDKVDMKVGDNVKINATVDPADAGALEFASSDVSVVTVNDLGEITAVGEGIANVTVRFTGNDKYAAAESKTITVTVSKIDTSIDAVEKVDMKIGDNVPVNATLIPAEAGELEFVSGDSSIVSVNSQGELTGVGKGTTVITVSFKGNDKYNAAVSKYVIVNVEKIDTSIDVDVDEVEMKVGGNAIINATVNPADAGALEFASSDVSVVTVNSLGEITAVGEGIANVTVRFTGNDKYAPAESKNITVTVGLNDASVSAEDITLIIDDNATIVATTDPEGLNITYIADDSGVVSVENGVVTALKEGTAKINLTVGGDGKYALNSTTINVTVLKIDTSIDVADDEFDMKVGDNVTVTATLSPEGASGLDFTSGDVSVAIVNSLGEITAVGEGSTLITVGFAGNDKYNAAENKFVLVTVSRTDASIDVDVGSVEMNVGDNLAINATLSPEEAGELEFVSSDVNVVAVNDLGELTAVGEGTAIITVKFQGNDKYNPAESKNIIVTVKKVPTSIDADEKVSMKVGDNVTVNATLTPAEAGELIFTSDDESVVTVNALGEITAVGEGSTFITVKFAGDDKYAAAESKKILVTVSKIETSIDVVDNVDMKVDDNVNVNATLTPDVAGELEFTSSDESVVTVNALGEITAVGEGKAVIYVKFSGNNKYAAAETKNVFVTVNKIPTSISADENVDMKVDDKVTVNATLSPDVVGELEFVSGDVSVVTVNDLGEITAVGEGIANVTVRFTGNDKYAAAVSKIITVTVSKIDTSIEVVDNVDMKVGDNVIADAVLTPAEAGELEFVSGDESIVTVNALGEITAVGEGIANVTVIFTGNNKYAAAESKNITVTVSKIDTSIEVVDQVDMKVGDNVTADAVLTPVEAGELEFASSDESVVTVNALGEITAVGEGSAIVTVSFTGNDKYAAAESKNITVTVSKIDTSIDAADKVEMKVGDIIALNATLTPAEAGELEFVSGDSSIVSVNSQGELTAVGSGTIVITVSFAGNDKYNAAATKYVIVNVTKIDTSIDVGADKVDMKVGDNVTIDATVDPADAGALEFASSDVSVVTVNDLGEITAVGAGSAVITVRFTGNDKYAAAESKTITVTVSKIDTSIDAVEKVDMKIGDNVPVNATLIPAEAGELEFVSGDSSIVSVNSQGELTGVGKGTTVITISFKGNDKYNAAVSKYVIVNVEKIDTSIDVDVDEVEMKVGGNAKIDATVNPAGAGALDFTSSDESVVTVNSLGEITAVGAGIANVTVRFTGNDKYAPAESKNITVTVGLNDASVSAEDITLIIDDSATIVATTDSEGLNITYIADDSGVVSVENGVVTALKEGTAKINLTVGGDGKYALNSTTINVTVLKIDTSIDVGEDKFDMKVGDNVTVTATLSPEGASGLDFTSGDESVAVVNSLGEITAVGEGSTLITVGFAGNEKYAAAESKFVLVTVSKVDASIEVDARKVEMLAGDKVMINVTLSPADAGEIVFTSTDESVVTVNDLGELTAVGEGSAVITVKFEGNDKYDAAESRFVLVTVSKTDASIDAVDNVNMKVGDKTNVNATLSPADVGKLVFTSSDVSVVSVNSLGEITAVGAGSAVITVKFEGNDKFAAVSKNITVSVTKKASKFAEISIVKNNVTFVLNDENGNPISGAVVSYSVNGVPNTVVSDDKGSFVIVAGPGASIQVAYAGGNVYDSLNTTINLAPQRQSTVILGNDYTQYAIEYDAGERGQNFTVQLKDASGNVLANKQVLIGYNGKILYRTTNATGHASVQINLRDKNRLTFAVSFLGDEDYDATMSVYLITIKQKPVTITAYDKVYKSAAKTKKYTVRLKTILGASCDGKTYFAAGKKVTLKLDGKTYTAKTNANGQVTFNLKITKKGIFDAEIAYAGDNTYKSASKTVKIITM